MLQPLTARRRRQEAQHKQPVRDRRKCQLQQEHAGQKQKGEEKRREKKTNIRFDRKTTHTSDRSKTKTKTNVVIKIMAKKSSSRLIHLSII